MTFDDLQTEFFKRGFDYLNEDAAGQLRAQRWLNDAYREMWNLEAWPFAITSIVSDVTADADEDGQPDAPYVSVPDLRRVLLVTDQSYGVPGRPLQRVREEDLVQDEAVWDLGAPGTPECYYIDGSLIRPYPVGGLIYVRYLRRVSALSGGQEPDFAEDYHNLIVDRACVKAYIDSDNYDAATALKGEYESGLQAMREDYQIDSRDPDYVYVASS